MLILKRERAPVVGVTPARPVFDPAALRTARVTTWVDAGDPQWLNGGHNGPRSGRRAICRDGQYIKGLVYTAHVSPNWMGNQEGHQMAWAGWCNWIWREKAAIQTAGQQFTWKYGCIENKPADEPLIQIHWGDRGWNIRWPFYPRFRAGASFYFLWAIPDISAIPADGWDGINYFCFRPDSPQAGWFPTVPMLQSHWGNQRFSNTFCDMAEGRPDVSAMMPGFAAGVRPATPNQPILMRMTFDGRPRSQGGRVWLYSQHTGVSQSWPVAADRIAEDYNPAASNLAKALTREDSYHFFGRIKASGADLRAWMRLFEMIWVEHRAPGVDGMISRQEDLLIRRYLQDAWGFTFNVPVTATQFDTNLPDVPG